MTDFNVQPAALSELAALLDRAGEDVVSVIEYLARIRTFEGGGGLLHDCLAGHEAAYWALSDWLTKEVGPTLAGTSAAVTSAASYYQGTDVGAAAQLDATFPETRVTEIREHTDYVPIESEGTGRFTDPVEPGGYLTEPDDYTTKLYGSTLDWWDTTSPLSVLGMFIQRVSEVAVWLGWLDEPYHPMKELAEPFVGDWAGARAAADVLRNVGRAVNYVAVNLKWASQGTEQVWQGNAGDGAAVYLMNLAGSLDVDNAWPPIDKLAQQYVDAAEDMVNLRDAAVGVLNAIGDAAIFAAFACGVAGGAASTGVGAPVGGLAALVAGTQIARVVSGIHELNGIVGELAAVTSALKAAQGGFSGPGRLSMPQLPAAPIRTPGQVTR